MTEEDKIEHLEDIIYKIQSWVNAYPLDIFPEPDLRLARAALEAKGLTLDSVSASSMRHVLKGIGEIIDGAREVSDRDSTMINFRMLDRGISENGLSQKISIALNEEILAVPLNEIKIEATNLIESDCKVILVSIPRWLAKDKRLV